MKDKIGKSIIYNSIGTAAYLFCQWLITFIVVWLAGYETAGILSVSMSVSTTFAVIATFNMRNYQSSDLNEKYSEKTYLISRIITSLVALVVTFIYSIIKNFSLFQTLCINAFMIFKLNEAFVDVLHGSIQRKWKFNIIGISYFMRGIISILLFSLGLYFTNNLLISLILMSIGVYIFIILFDIKNYRKEFKNLGEFKKSYLVSLLLMCVPLVFYGFIFNYISMYPKVMVEQIYGTEMLGYYSSVATPALIIQVAATFIFNPLISLFADYYKNKDFKQFDKTLWKILGLIILLGIVGLISSYYLADWGLNLLFGKEILQYTYLFSGVIIVSVLTAIIWFLGMLLTIVRNYIALIGGSILTLIVTYILAPILINKYNLNGINFTLIISFIIQILVYLFSVLKIKKNSVNDNKIYYIRSTSIINDSRASKEITSLINNDYKVTVLGWDRDKKIKDYKNVVINNNLINGKYFKFNAGYGESIKNIFGLAFFQIWVFYHLLKDNKKYEYIHACDFDCGFISLIICKLFNKKLVYDMYDYYSDSRTMPPKVEKIINKLENLVIDNSYVSIICGEWRKKQIEGTSPREIVVIHNTPNINNIDNKKIIKSKSKKIKLVYVGILQDHRLLLEVVDKIAENDNYELHIGGFGKYEEQIKLIADKCDNIYFYGSLPYNDVLCLEKDCDILFATYDPKIKNHKYSAPNKVYEAMALGKPIIVCKNTGIDKLVKENDIGLVVKYDADNFINQLNEFTNTSKLKEINKKTKKLYDTKYNWKSMEQKLIEIYMNNKER